MALNASIDVVKMFFSHIILNVKRSLITTAAEFIQWPQQQHLANYTLLTKNSLPYSPIINNFNGCQKLQNVIKMPLLKV